MKFAELLKKKAQEGKFLSDDEQRAKLDLVKEIDEMAGEGMMDSLKKVTVAAPTAEGLEEGLEKASDVLESGEIEELEGEECEMMEEPSKEEKIAMLRAELAQLEGAEEL